MKNINEISESLRKLIIDVQDFQKKLEQTRSFDDRKEYLIKEFVNLSLTQTETMLLSANEMCSNPENCDELSLEVGVNGMKQIINSFNQQSPSANNFS